MTKFTFATDKEGFDNHINPLEGILTYGVTYFHYQNIL